MSTGTPEQVLKSVVDGINADNLDALLPLYEPAAALRVSLAASVTEAPARPPQARRSLQG